MVKVKLPDIRKNKLSVIIKSLEKRDAAMQRFQRRDLYNAKSVKVAENTQIELYLPTLLGDKGKPAWSGSTQPDNGRKGAETRAKNGTKDSKDDGHRKGGSDDSKSSRKKANGSDASELGNGTGNGKVNVMMGRKIPNKRPLLTNGLKTLRVDEGIGPFSAREAKEREKASSGTTASKVEMVFKPGQALVSAKESQRFGSTKTNMLSLKSWNQNNPTENAYHWLSSGPGELDQVQIFKTSIGKNLLGRGARNGKALPPPDPAMTSTEKFTVSMVKPSLPQVSTSPPHSHHILEQILQQQLEEEGEGRERGGEGGLLWRQKSLSPSHSGSVSPTRGGREKADGEMPATFDANEFSAHQRSYHHGEFSSYRDNSHIQGNISQQHARTGKGGQSFIEASFLVKNVSKNGTPQVVSGLTGPQLSPPRPQGLGIKGTSPKKLNRPPGTTNRTTGSTQSSPSLPPRGSEPFQGQCFHRHRRGWYSRHERSLLPWSVHDVAQVPAERAEHRRGEQRADHLHWHQQRQPRGQTCRDHGFRDLAEHEERACAGEQEEPDGQAAPGRRQRHLHFGFGRVSSDAEAHARASADHQQQPAGQPQQGPGPIWKQDHDETWDDS